MRYLKIIAVLLLMAFPDFGKCFAQDMTHPRLILRKGEEVALASNIARDAMWTRLHEIVLEESERLLQIPEQEYRLGARKAMHSQCCETVRRMLFITYAYRMTGDRRFLDKAEKLILNMCALDSWNPYHFLDVAELTVAASFAYDWLYHDLNPRTRELLKECIRDYALTASETGGGGNKDYNLRWMDMTSNWSQICHGSLAIASIALYDEERELADRIISRSIRKMHIPMEAEYMPMGAYSQGIGYWGYGTALNVMFLDSMQKFFGPDSVSELVGIPGFMQTGTYYCQLLTNTLESFAFSDNSTGENLPEHCIFWFYDKTRDPALLHYQKQLLERCIDTPSKLTSGTYARHLPLMMVWGAGTGSAPTADFANAEAPEELFYLAEGLNPICTMRSGWDRDDIWVGFKAGNPSCAHGHMDVGTFMFEYGGARFGVDLGSDGYGKIAELKIGSMFKMDADAIRWNNLMRYNNFSHSTLTIDGQFQNLDTKAEFISHSDDEDRMYAVADMTSTYSGQLACAKRGVGLIDRKYIVVEDLIQTRKSSKATVVWNLTTMASEYRYDKDTGEIILGASDADGKMQYVRIIPSLENKEASPSGISVKRTSVNSAINYPHNEKPADGCWFIRLKFSIAKDMTQRLRCIIVPEGEAVPENMINIIQ